MSDNCVVDSTSATPSLKSTTAADHFSGLLGEINSFPSQGEGDGKSVEFRRFLETLNLTDEFHAKDGRITKIIGLPESKPPVLVDLESHTITELRGHTSVVHSAAFSSDGSRIVTASADHTARLWNGTNGAPIAILNGHNDAVWNAAFNPDGSRVVTASHDHTARLWATDGRR